MKKISFPLRFFLCVILISNLSMISYAQTRYYVDNDATGSADGLSWANAYNTLYDALATASAGDTIWVAAGTYYPEAEATPRLSTFTIDKKIALYGGFDGSETLLSERNFTGNETILSGDIGVQDDSTDNTYHVISFEFANTDEARLDGFIIQDGRASPTGGTDVQRGGAIWMIACENKIIANCTFRNNTAMDNGGAVFMSGCKNILISNCHFYENHQSSATGADYGGGAISSVNSVSGSLQVDSCIFEKNTATGHGGAIYASSTEIITNSSFINNSCVGSNGHGGAAYFPGNISNCRFESNKANTGHGGAIICGWKVIENSLFIDNMAALNGGAIHKTNSGQIINCTFIGNHGHEYGGAICDEGTSTEIVNCIFSNNIQLLSLDNSVYNLASNPLNITYSCTPESIDGTGNITADPGFVNDGTFYLAANSPCIDAGNGDVAPVTDLDGKLRHDDFGARNTGTGTPDYADMGVFEFQGSSSLNGQYTIGSTGDFTSFSEAVDSLISLGISNSVLFTVEAGTYTEQLVIPEISGATDSTTITFQSASGDSTDVILTYAATLENENYTLKLDGADYITFKNMTLQATGTSYARVVEITNGTKHNEFLNNRFEGVENSNELVCNINDPVLNDTSIVFSNNYFIKGKKAIHWHGSYDMSISDNMFYHQQDTAVFMVYGRVSSIKNNLFYSNHRATAILLYEHFTDFAIEKNRIYLKNGGRGIDIYGRGENNTLINNYLYLNTNEPDIGIQMYSSFGMTVQLLHNTIHITGHNESSICYRDPADFYNISLQSNNNNFVNLAGGAVLSGRYAYGNYNNLYSNGPYLTRNFDHQSLELVRQERNKELNSVSVNPYFSADTSWTTTHPALNNSGTGAHAIATDIEGKARNVDNPDIGACEFTPNPVPFSGTYSIGGATPDYETINHAIDAMIINGINGQTRFILENESFEEVVRIPKITGASSVNNITFTSPDTDTSIITSSYDYTVKLDGADYITFDKIKIVSKNSSYPKVVIIENGASNNRFVNNIITQDAASVNAQLIYSGPGAENHNIFESNIFSKGSNGIYLSGRDVEYGQNNQILRNNFLNILHYPVRVIWQDTYIISGNNIYNNNTPATCVSIENSRHGLIANNMINAQEISGAPKGIVISNSDHQKIFFNSIRLNATYNSAIALRLDGKNIEVKNNILYSDGIGYAITCSDSTGFISDYNLLYSNNIRMTQWLGKDVNGFEAWQDQSAQDAHSYFFEPEFLSENDLHTNDLRLNSAGVPVAEVSEDFDGDTRDASHPDIGADEVDMGVPMAGEYQIGPSRTFKTFGEAIDSIVAVGVADSVIFLVDAGTYTEQILIPHIPLSSVQKTVAFRSATGIAEDVVLEYKSSDTANYIVMFDSASYVGFENMTMNALDDTSSVVIRLENNTTNIIIKENRLNGNGVSAPVIYALNGNNSNNLFVNNTITGGLNGITLIGEDGIQPTGNTITGNTLVDQHQAGLYLEYQQFQKITGNKVSHSDTINTKWVGIGLVNCTSTSDSMALMANNMVHYTADQLSAGILLSGSSFQNIYHNNVNVIGDAEQSRAFNQEEGGNNIKVYNNIFSNKANGLVIYSTNPGNIHYDYNVLYTTGERFIYTDNWISNLTAWQSFGKGNHSLTLDPRFVSDSDLHIEQLQLFGKGMSIAEITDDFDGDKRDQENVTIGADVMTGTCTEPLSGIISIGADEAYESVNDAVAALILCGMEGSVVFEIAPGTYNEQVVFPKNFTGKTPEDSLVFRSASGDAEDAIITFEASKSDNYVIKLDGLDNFVLQNITLEAQNSHYGRLIEFSNHANNSLFEGNIFRGIESRENNDSLVLIYYQPESIDSSQVFINNTFINGSRAIVKENAFTRTDVLEIQNNQFLNQGYGILSFKNIHLIMFEENTINTKTSVFRGFEGGLTDSLSICKNRVKVELEEGVFIDSYSQNIFMANNFISFESFSNKYLNLINPNGEFYCYYNTFVISGNNQKSNIYFRNGSHNYIFDLKNNVAVNLARGKVFNFYYGIPNYTSDHNNLFTNGEMLGEWSGTAYQNFSDYISTTGHDANSVSANPAFLNDSTWYSRHILHSNTGTPVPGVTTDLDGNTRDGVSPDIGAEEFETVRYGLGEDIRLCAGDEVVLDAGVGFESYNWSTGSDSSTTVIDTLGTGMGPQEVWVTVVMDGNEYQDTITVDLNLPVATPVTDYCFNENEDSILISAGEGAEYRWSNGKRTQSIYITGGNWHYVTVTDEYGCSSEGTVQVHYNGCVADFDMPVDSVIHENDSIVIESNQCRYDYDWFDYSWNTGDTTHQLTLHGKELGIGTHEIVVTVTNYSANSCTTSDTILITVDEASGSINKEMSDGILLYPNPTTGKLIIDNQQVPIKQIKVYDLLGNLLLWQKEVTNEIDLGGQSKGVYLIWIESEETLTIHKIVVK